MSTLHTFLFNSRFPFFYFYRRLDLSLQLPISKVSDYLSQTSTILSPKADVQCTNVLGLYVDTLDLFDTKSDSKKSLYDETGVLINPKSWSHYFVNRYGVGDGIVSFLESFCGQFPKGHVNISHYNSFFYTYGFSFFFFKSKHSFDIDLAKIGNYTFSKHKERFTFKGWCHINGYPINGQKRRSNYKTTRKMKYFSILRANVH